MNRTLSMFLLLLLLLLLLPLPLALSLPLALALPLPQVHRAVCTGQRCIALISGVNYVYC
jgi:hypothetical protein